MKKNRLSPAGTLVLITAFAVLRLPGATDEILVSNGNKGAVCVFRNNLIGMESPMQLLVPQNRKMIIVGYPEDVNGSAWYPSACWSRDKRLVMTSTEKGPYLAYDFENQETLTVPNQIRQRLKQHGGYGEPIFESSSDMGTKSHHPWLWELRCLNYR